MEPLFTILLPTYKRPERVIRAIQSVQQQTYKNWRLIIVIDDPLSNYSQLDSLVKDDLRVTTLRNSENIGKNGSLNQVLERLKQESYAGYVVFLDDDDWLAKDCLATFASVLKETSHTTWLVADRATQDGHSLVQTNLKRPQVHYQKDMLLFRRFRGETTHAIPFSEMTHSRFPTYIKNAEEWIFFASVAARLPFFTYLPFQATLTDGYPVDGLTRRCHSKRERIKTYGLLWREVFKQRLLSPYILVYLLLRLIRLFIKPG